MKAALLYAPYDLRVEEIPMPELVPGKVLIKVGATGLCGTDLLVYMGRLPCVKPIILGHEFAGEIFQIGRNDRGLKMGDRVVAAPSWTCGDCHPCKRGEEADCLNRQTMGRNVCGALAEYVSVPEKAVFAIPEQISYQEAQSLGMIRCALRACDTLGHHLQDIQKMAIIGPGHAGLILLQVFKSMGIQDITILGTRKPRLDLAVGLGAKHVINIKEDNVTRCKEEMTGGRGFDLIVEASGNSEALKQAMSMVRKRGVILIFGVADTAENNLPAREIYSKELTIVGSQGGAGKNEKAMRLLQSNKIQILPLISHVLPIEEAEKGFKLMELKEANALRIVITPDPHSL